MRKIYFFLILLFAATSSFSQTYFSESFESEFTPNTAAGPNAPTGWTQTRLGTLTGVPGTPGTGGQRDWGRIEWSGTAWASNTAPNTNQIPYSSATNGPVGAKDGTAALWFNDGWASGASTTGQNLRRIETPSVDLSSSINPYIIFFHSQNTSSAGLTLQGSLDGGVTWNVLATYGSTSNWSWVQRIFAVPASYKIATAKFAFQVSNTYGSFDVFIDNLTIQEPIIANITSSAQGGLWSSPATWAGGVVPSILDNVTIVNGSIVTIDAAVSVGSLTIGGGTSGVLQWNATSTAMTVINDITIAAGARFLAHTTGLTGQTINVGGNFINNGYANLALTSTLLNFNGSQQGSSSSQVFGGTGTFAGDGTKGIIRALFFQTTGSSTISTTQNLITGSFGHTAGALNTNGKLTIDNAPQVYGQTLNLQVANIAVTNMGTAYTAAPVVFGASATLWVASATAVANTRYFSGNNVYVSIGAGTFDASTAPTHTSGSAFNGSATLVWIGTLGTIGNPFILTATTVGTQYFYGNKLYVCTVAGVPDPANPPVHTTGAVASGAATFLYVGTPATVTSNYDAATQTVRSLNLTSAGTGYSSAPTIVFSLNGGTVTTAASATATYIQGVFGPVNSLTQKSGTATISGGLTINSTQNATAYSGVGNAWVTNGGVNYTVAPTVGFAGPTAINLVTNGGSGYAAVPTVIVTGGTLITGTALTTSNFTVTVAGGRVVSVYLATGTTATYSVPPTLAFSTGTATLAFPTGCWPAATATIGSNGQLTNFIITNTGFGYIAAPTMGIGAVSGTGANTGGTFTTVAGTPVCRIALYNITFNNFIPSPTAVINADQSIFPANGRMNLISTTGVSLGTTVANNLELFAAAPLTLTAGVIDMGANTLTLSNTAYAGTSGSATSSVSGKITLTTPGGSVTRTFPYDASVAIATGTGSLGTGSTVTSLTATRVGAPTGSISGGVASLTGSRSYRVQANSGSAYGTQPTVTLNYNTTDALTTVNNADLLIVQAAALTGAWTVRSLSSGTGVLSATGSRTTATAGAGPIVPTGDDYFAWSTSLPCSGTPTTGVITGSTDACAGGTITFASSVFSSGNGMTYRWQTSPDNVTWTNTTVTTPGAYSATFAGAVWVRRVDTCTNGNAFAISNAIQVVARAATLCYCGPNSGTTIHSFTSNSIDNVTITGTTLNNSNIGIGNTNGYTEFPQSGNTTATLLQSTTYSLSTTLSASSIASVWFDWNRNGTYEASEWTQITTTGTGNLATSFTVPASATLGVTGMRVRTRGTGSANASTDACTSFGSGETEEYYITIAAPSACSGTPNPGVVTGPSSTVCGGVNFTLTATGFSSGLAGLTYRWQSSPDNVTWTNTNGTTPSSFTTSANANTWFRLVDTCTNGNAFAVSNAVQVTVNAATYASLPFTEGFETTWINGCATADIPSNSWRNRPAFTDSSWRREDDAPNANTATWGNPTSYLYSPAFSQGAHSARFHSGYVNNRGRGIMDLYLNCSVGSSSKQLSFDYININGTDSLTVFVSTDAGLSFTRLDTVYRRTVWSNKTILFTSASATTIVRFMATGDYGSTDIGLDNLNITTLNNCSGTPTTGVITGPSTACAGNAFTISSTVFSSGTSGLTYRWQTSPDNVTWTNTTGTTPGSFSTSITAPTWFRRADTCTLSGLFAVSNVIQVTVNAATYVSLPFTEGFESTWINGCATADVPNNNWRNRPAFSDSSWRREDDAPNANTAAWNNATSYLYSPAFSQGAHSARFHSGYVNNRGRGIMDLYLNCSVGSSSKQLSFDYININGTDSLTVFVSTDAGATFARLDTVFLRTIWSKKTISFTSASATTIVRFMATADYGSTDIGLDNISITSGVVPVSFTQFKGERQGANNLLSWTTATEINNAGFELQRSADGVNFSAMSFIASKAANGNSNATLTYNFTDTKSLTTGLYYRLKQIDKDGKSTISSVVFIKGNKVTKLELASVYPNPAIDRLNLIVASPKADNITFMVSDLAGKVIMTKLVSVINGDNNIQLNVSTLAKGTYTIKAICADGCETAISKFIKQ